MRKPYSTQIHYILTAVISMSGCTPGEPPGEGQDSHRELVLSVTTPNVSAIRFINNGDQTAHFELKFNDGLFLSDQDMLSAIKNMKPEFQHEPLHRKAWRFVMNHSARGAPITQERWLHDPLLFINSLGFGYCDDRAFVLSSIWNKLGYRSRVWGLEGHVVPEVLTDLKWEMYDPTLEVYYLNQANQVAGVEDLASNPLLITEPIARFNAGNDIIAVGLRYSRITALNYMTRNDNSSSDYDSDLPGEELYIDIPPLGTFELPAIYESSLMVAGGKSISTRNYANARLTIPAHWSGLVRIPLAIHSIRGSGTLVVDNKRYHIGSVSLQTLIHTRASFLHELRVSADQSPVSIVYLLNSRSTRLKAQNTIIMKGAGVQSVSAQIIELPDTLRFNYDYEETMDRMVKDYFSNFKRLEENTALRSFRISGKSGLLEKVRIFIDADKLLTLQEKTTKLNGIQRRIEELFVSKAGHISMRPVFEVLDDNAIFALFLTLLDYKTNEELIPLMTKYLDKQDLSL